MGAFSYIRQNATRTKEEKQQHQTTYTIIALSLLDQIYFRLIYLNICLAIMPDILTLFGE